MLQIIALLALLIYAMGPSALSGVAVVLVLTPLQSKFMTMAESLRGDIAKVRKIIPLPT